MATARKFAATLGIIAFVFVVGFGLFNGAELNWILIRGLISLVVFSVIGYVTGLIGAGIATDAANGEVRKRAEAEARRKKRADAERAKAAKARTSEGGASPAPTAAGTPGGTPGAR